MNSKTTYILLIFTFFSANLFAQEEEEDWTEKEDKTPLFFGGVNVGAFFANNNTSTIYTGGYDITPFGVDYILNLPHYKPSFDTYFKYPYAVAELPLSPAYKIALDIGLHAGINVDKMTAIYVDINSSQIKYEQFFTVAIEDPLNQSVDPTYEQLPILGEEKRFNLNLGTQLSLYNEENTNLYWSLFGNFNSVKLERNYIVINNREYEIHHMVASQQSNSKPGGIGYGAGTGLGFKYKLTTRVAVDFNYNLYYIKTNMTTEIQPFGLHNGLMLRVIWN